VWEDIGITSFDGPLEALFAAQTVAEANKILTNNGLPPLVQCSTVSYASVHVHVQGARNGSNDADLLRAAELIQIEVDAGRFVVTGGRSTAQRELLRQPLGQEHEHCSAHHHHHHHNG
jgi:hypothetical protein